MNNPGLVLIVGAGPTGLTAAFELSRMGIPVRLIEKAEKPSTTSRAIGVQARTLELFEQRGLSDHLVGLGNQSVAVSTYGGGKQIFRLEFKDLDSKYKYILFVSQAETEKTLRDALEKNGVTVEWNTAMVAFSQVENSDELTAVLEHPDGSVERMFCSYLIAAEGAHSIVRQTLGLHFEGKSLEEQYALGDFYIEGDLPDSDLHIFSSEHGFLGMFPLGNQRYRMIASNANSKPSDGDPSIEELQSIYDQRSHIPVKFRDLSWSSWFHINSRMIHHLSVGRVFLGGDSSHIHSPAGAQGMNTGIQDMIDLSWKLAMVLQGHAKPQLLDTYSADRVPVIQNVLTKTEGLTRAIGEENPTFRSVFNHIAPWVVGTDFVQHASTERMSQLGLNYRQSPLSENHGADGSLKAGDRVPDVAVSLLNQPPHQSTTTFKLMDPSNFTLFYSNFSAPYATHVEAQRHLIRRYHIAAQDGQAEAFAQLFGKSPSIYMVRPDGYVAFAGSGTSLPLLARYCDKWLAVQEPSPTLQKVETQSQESHA